jgi:hypothetical protein
MKSNPFAGVSTMSNKNDFSLLTKEEKKKVYQSCSDCVKFRNKQCIVYNCYHCLKYPAGPECSAKERSPYRWKKQLITMLEYVKKRTESSQDIRQKNWLISEIRFIQERIDREIRKVYLSEVHKKIEKFGQSEGKEKSRKKSGRKLNEGDYDIPRDWNTLFRS